MRRAARIGVLFTAVGLVGWLAWPRPPEPEPVVAGIERIPPGAVIDRGPPAGWSHLVVKSRPRIRETDRAKVNALTARSAAWMFTAFVADVRAGRLRAVALGLGCEAGGRDVVVTPETAEQYGADLGWVTRTVLTKGYERQAEAKMIARTPTFALVDTPVWFRTAAGEHRAVRFRYALLAGGGDRLDVAVWVVGADGVGAVRLDPNTFDPAELVVDTNQITLGVPAESAFAVDRLPPGRPAGDPPATGMRDAYSPDEARALQAELRRWLSTDPRP